MKKYLWIVPVLLLVFTQWTGEARSRSYSISFTQDTAVARSRGVKMASDRKQQAYYAWKLAEEMASLIPDDGIDYENLMKKRLAPYEAMTGYYVAEKAERSVREAVRYQALNTYYGLLKVRGLEDVAKEAVKVGEEQVRLTRQLHASGMVTWSDVLKSQADLAQMEADLVSLESAVEIARLAFNDLVGADLDQVPSLEEEISFERMGSIDLDYHVKRAESRRFEVYQAEMAVGVKELDLELAGAMGNANLMKMKEAALSEAERNLSQKKDEVRLQVHQAYQKVLETQKKVTLFKKGVASAEEALRVTRLKHEQGMVTDIEVMAAKMALAGAEHRYTDAICEYDLAKAAFYYATSEGMLQATPGGLGS